MPNIISYGGELQKSDSTQAEKELEYRAGDIVNIGWYCFYRICQKGNSNKVALIYEDSGSSEERCTFNDVSLASNTIGKFLLNLRLKNEDRVCLFMDRKPELYFPFLGILKMGGISQILFSAFEDESLFVRLKDSQIRVIITQRKHLFKVLNIRYKLSNLEFIIVVDHIKSKEPEENEIAFSLEETPCVKHISLINIKLPCGICTNSYQIVDESRRHFNA